MHWRHPAAIFEVKWWLNTQNAHRLTNEQSSFDLNAGAPYWNDVMCIRSIAKFLNKSSISTEFRHHFVSWTPFYSPSAAELTSIINLNSSVFPLVRLHQVRYKTFDSVFLTNSINVKHGTNDTSTKGGPWKEHWHIDGSMIEGDWWVNGRGGLWAPRGSEDAEWDF